MEREADELKAASKATSAGADGLASVTVIVPTYREAENLPHLLQRLAAVREAHGLDLDVLIMDDNSQDGSEEAVAASGYPWARLVVRTENRGLSPAVIDGLRLADQEVALVMDADLSHPPEKIPELLAALENGAEFVIGSRYVAGGSTDAEWGLLRWVNSKVATWLAWPFTSVKDPMAGFFAFRRADLAQAAPLNPVGYKIGLELIVKCGFKNVVEVPIHFGDRQYGESKLSLKEQLRYLQHLRRLGVYKYGEWSHAAQFAVVGASGVVVNLATLTILDLAGVAVWLAYIFAVGLSMVTNFLLNRRFTFSYARSGSIAAQFAGFITTCLLGAVVNYWVWFMALRSLPEPLQAYPQLAVPFGVAAGLVFNFFISRYVVFRRTSA